ncbi:MAG: hypothetical protein DUD39_01910 [Coriobacteriaceae bacterium]|nr:MAG: hypothetical protein DUD39_01910 [Coriobacteriaceae bacterium]
MRAYPAWLSVATQELSAMPERVTFSFDSVDLPEVLHIRSPARLALCDCVPSGHLHIRLCPVACDMNADFECAFLKRCLRLDIVYEHFHLAKNFNEKVICKVRKDRQARLSKEGAYRQGPRAQALQVHPYVLYGHQGQRRARRPCRAGSSPGE